jgi:hypothetical protein
VTTDAPGAAACNDGTRQVTYRRGAPMAAPENVFQWHSLNGVCGGSGGVVGQHYAVDRVDDRQFLAAQLVEIDTGGPLAVRAIVADDGSWERAQLVDVGTGAPCGHGYRVVDERTVLDVCAPQGVGLTGNSFAGPDCAGEPLIVVPDDGTCEVTQFVTDGVDWWRVGPAYEGEVYELWQDECVPGDIDVDVLGVYERGEAIDPPSTIAYERVPVPDGDGERLQPWGVLVDGVPTLLTRHESSWYDATLAAPCDAVELPEGGRICAHAIDNGPPREWGDPECTSVPLFGSFSSAALPPLVVRTEYDGCRLLALEAQTVVGPWRGAVYERDVESGACTPFDDRDPNREYLQLGNYVQLADLPPLVIETL